MRISQHVDRNAAIYADRKAGMTFRALGERHGISLERVRQIFFRGERDERARRLADKNYPWVVEHDVSLQSEKAEWHSSDAYVSQDEAETRAELDRKQWPKMPARVRRKDASVSLERVQIFLRDKLESR